MLPAVGIGLAWGVRPPVGTTPGGAAALRRTRLDDTESEMTGRGTHDYVIESGIASRPITPYVRVMSGTGPASGERPAL